MNKLKPRLIDLNKIPFKELWQEARFFADDIVCAVGTDFMQKITEAEHKVICDLLNHLQQMEVVEAVPVVRCRECKHLNVVNRKELYAHCPKTNTVFLPFELDTREHFCSLGERKEGVDNG